MLLLKFCVQCGKLIPKHITKDRLFCSSNCNKRFKKKNGEPRLRVREFLVNEFGEDTVARHEADDPEFAASLVYDLKRVKTCKVRTKGGRGS
jgi:predicted nucleic acid-binding Zn ribbon protein